VVQRLVPGGLLRVLAGAQSARAGERREEVLARRLVAAPRQDGALLRALQHPSAVSVRGLRLPGGARPGL